MTTSEKAALKRELQQALGQVVRQLRQRRRDKPSQQALADAVSMDRSYWGDLERGERSLTLFNLWRVAQALGVSPSRLVLAIDNERRHIASPSMAPAKPRPFQAELKRFQRYMDQARVMQWFVDGKRNCLYCNKPLIQYLGRPFEEVAGQRWREFMHPEDREKYMATNKKEFTRRQPFISKYRVRRADGAYVWVVQRATPQFTPKGIFLGFLGTMIPESNGG